MWTADDRALAAELGYEYHIGHCPNCGRFQKIRTKPDARVSDSDFHCPDGTPCGMVTVTGVTSQGEVIHAKGAGFALAATLAITQGAGGESIRFATCSKCARLMNAYPKSSMAFPHDCFVDESA